MNKNYLREVVDTIDKAGIDRYIIYMNNGYNINVSESTKVIFDDDREAIHVFRVPANVSPMDPRSIIYETYNYEIVERFMIPTDVNTLLGSIVTDMKLTLTDEITEFIKKAGSQQGLYPAQSNRPQYDEDGKLVNDGQIGHIPSVK